MFREWGGTGEQLHHLPGMSGPRRTNFLAGIPFGPPDVFTLWRGRQDHQERVPGLPGRGLQTRQQAPEGDGSGRNRGRQPVARHGRRPTRDQRWSEWRLVRLFFGKDHPVFERRENDLHCSVPINIAQAALGDEIEVPTLEGPHKMQIPEGLQSGAELRVRGRGVAEVNGRGKGDLVVHITVKTPTKLNRDQRKLFEQLAATLPVNNEPHEKGLLDKVKDLFS